MMNKKPVVTALVAFLVAFLIAFAMTREQAPAVTQATADPWLSESASQRGWPFIFLILPPTKILLFCTSSLSTYSWVNQAQPKQTRAQE